MQNGIPNATSTRISPESVLNRCSRCITQIVGTIAGGMIRPDSTSRLTALEALPGRRCRTKPTIEQRNTSTVTETTVRMMLFLNAVTSS